MEWLLKIVEGPMKGAEIALVEGVGVSFGSGDECDIVVQDATVPAKACEFEVDATGVRMAVGGGSAEALPAFEVRSFGTTSFAVGPVSGEWQSLIKPVKAQLTHADAEEAPAAKGTAEGGAEDAHASENGASGETAASDAPHAKRRRGGILATCVLLVLGLIAAGLVWWFWPQIVEKCPKAETVRLACVERARAWYGAVKGWCGGEVACETPAAPRFSLDDIARQYGLRLSNLSNPSNPARLLSGNLKRRTERLAIRALALAAEPTVKFDLTDDETLFAASSELVFACSDGALKVDAATNRVVTLSGYSPSREALEKAVRALNADVKGIVRLETSRVTVGGPAPAAVAKTPFVRETPPGECPVVVIPAHTPNPPMKKAKKDRDFPIAGILTAPYPCVVMRNGLRLAEGAQVGNAILVKIEADKLTLNDGGRTVEWKP